MQDHGRSVPDGPIEVLSNRPTAAKGPLHVESTSNDRPLGVAGRPILEPRRKLVGPLYLGEVEPLAKPGELAEVKVGVDEPR